MSQIERVSRQQMMWMYANSLLGASLLFLPQLLVAEAKQDAWITALIGAAGGVCIALLYAALALRFPGSSPVQYFQAVLGRPLGLLAILTLFGYLFWVVLAMQREVMDFFVINYPETPSLFVGICFMLIEIYLLLNGLEVIARTHDLLFPFIVLGILALLAIALPYFSLQELSPVLSGGIGPVLTPLPSYLSFPYGNTVVFLMVFPMLRKAKDLPIVAAGGSMLGSMIIVLVTFFALFTMGAYSAARVVYPPHFGARILTAAGFLAGLDGLVDSIWIVSNVLRIVIFRYVLILIVAQLLGVSSYRYLVIPFSALTLVCSLNIYANIGEHIAFVKYPESWLAPIAYIVTPLLVLVVAIARRIKGGRLEG